MLIGVISDTHDCLMQIEKAVKFFKEKNIDAVIHAGDYNAPFALKSFFSDLKVPFYGVFGNVDGEKSGLTEKSGGGITEGPRVIELGGKSIMVVHNIKKINLDDTQHKYDVIIYGHTHKANIDKTGKSLVLNPGECCGFVEGKSTVALLDLDKMSAEITELPLD